MKAIKIRPYQRPLLVVLSLAILTGCSGIQSNVVYKSWEEKAYSAYKIAAPVHKQGILPALFKTVSIPGMNLLQRPKLHRVAYPQAKVTDSKENNLHYIESHYGL